MKPRIDDHSSGNKTTTIPAQEQQRPQQTKEGPEIMPEPEPINALELSIGDEEYVEFCRQCARERLEIPSRPDAAKVKRKFMGDWNGRPAWLQLRAVRRQYSARLWPQMDREQVLMELERQALTPPEPSKSQQSMANATRRFLEGS